MKLLIKLTLISLFSICFLPVLSLGQNLEDTLLLKNYEPHSIFKIQISNVKVAKYPVIDTHSHDYAKTDDEIREWIKNMDECGIEKTYLLSCNWIGLPFEKFVEKYSPYKDKFAFCCSFDYTDFDKPDWEKRAIESLVRCHELGAIGIGEMGDKGFGDLYGYPTEGRNIHLDNPKLKPLLEKCGELKMPIIIHIAEPIWMYQPIDRYNDGLINAAKWKVDTTQIGCLGYEQLMKSFENAVAANPKTIFIACHFLNMNQDLVRLGKLLDKYPNLYIDIAGRMAESSCTPRATRAFLIKYADRVLFGTDNGTTKEMYRNIFRILQTSDEHFYIPDYNYHWYYNGFNLPDKVLKKIYYKNAKKIFH